MRRGGTEQVLPWPLSHLRAQGRLGYVLAPPETLETICVEEGASPIPGLPKAESQCLNLIICSSF